MLKEDVRFDIIYTSEIVKVKVSDFMKEKEKIIEIDVLGETREQDYTKPINIAPKTRSARYEQEENEEINEEALEEVDDEGMKKKKKKRRLKKGVIQKTFWLISILFILGCCVFYGRRMIKYYRIYNPKESAAKTFGDAIVKDSNIATSGSGLYKVSGNYIYKGQEANNYLKYSNLLWRIIEVYEDGSVSAILEDNLNVMSYDQKVTSYVKSDINKYLNKVFIKHLNTKYLKNSTICLNQVEDLNSYVCNKTNKEDYKIKLIDVGEYLNSIADEGSYISNDELENAIWTSSYNTKGVWNIEGINVDESNADEAYFVKPVVTFKSDVKLLSGKGTKEEPFAIDKKKGVAIGDYVQLDEDLYVAYEVEDKVVKLQSVESDFLKPYIYSNITSKYTLEDYSGVANYLNNVIYYNMTYREQLLSTKWYSGNYNGLYEDVTKETMEGYIGLPNVLDLKFDSDFNYYLMTPVSDSKIYSYNKDLSASKIDTQRKLKITIAIDKGILKQGDGTKENPYKEGV